VLQLYVVIVGAGPRSHGASDRSERPRSQQHNLRKDGAGGGGGDCGQAALFIAKQRSECALSTRRGDVA
jgi:hypothetical protein